MYNAHILRTVYHFIRQADLFGTHSFTPAQKRVYRKCYDAMAEDVANKSKLLNQTQVKDKIVDMVATLQFCFPAHMRIQVEQRIPLRWYDDGTTILRTPVLIVVWPNQDPNHNYTNSLFTLN